MQSRQTAVIVPVSKEQGYKAGYVVSCNEKYSDSHRAEQHSMHEKKLNNLLKQPPQERYEYFIRHCADFEKVWGLAVGDDNWLIFKDAAGDEIFPVWPHSELAEICTFDEHKNMNATPREIGLESFLKNCIPDMASMGVHFGVFYNKERQGIAIEALALKSALEDEVKSVWE